MQYYSVSSSSSSRWRYSPGWALTSATICLQYSRFLALSVHSFIPIFLMSIDTSSSHLILGLPLRLVAYSSPYNIFFGIAVSCILSTCLSHLIPWHLINLTIFSPLIMVSNYSVRYCTNKCCCRDQLNFPSRHLAVQPLSPFAASP